MHYWVPCVINKGRFFEIAFVVVVDTYFPRFETLAYVSPEVFYSVFVKRSSFKSLLNLRKAYIFQEFAEGLLSICVC